MNLKTLKHCPNLNGKKVLLRTEFNVPLNSNQEITDDTRIKTAIPTIKYLIGTGAKIIICTHLGRPKGEIINKLSLKPVKKRLSELLGKEILFSNVYGKGLDKIINGMSDGDIMLLENIRFEAGEEKNDEILSKHLASLADIYISDAFGAVHRKHSSTYGVGKILDSYAGLLIEKEISELSKIFNNPNKPILAIIAGSKMETKIAVIDKFLDVADYIIVGGGVANTLLKAKGIEIGSSLYEQDEMKRARDLIDRGGKKLILPIDAIVSETISNNSTAKEVNLLKNKLQKKERILDIGPETIENYCVLIKKSRTIIWNGPVGVYEYKPFELGTKKLLQQISDSDSFSILGGGDTVDAMNKFGFDKKKFNHVSTGGGASLKLLEGKVLPGLEILCY